MRRNWPSSGEIASCAVSPRLISSRIAAMGAGTWPAATVAAGTAGELPGAPGADGELEAAAGAEASGPAGAASGCRQAEARAATASAATIS